MRLIIVVLVLGSALAINADRVTMMMRDKPIVDNCIKEIGITKEEMNAAIANHFEDGDEKIKCLAACILKAKGLLKEDGTIDVDKAVSDLPDDTKHRKEDIAKAIEKCSKKEENDCETAHNTISCVYGELKGR